MGEHVTHGVYYLEIHLIYASIVWVGAWLLTSVLNGSATAKYWIWVATSLNFILPLGAVVDALWAPHLRWAAPLSAVGDLGLVLTQDRTVAGVLFGVWSVVAALMFARLWLRIRIEGREAGERALGSRPGFVAQGVPVRFTGIQEAPAVGGVLRSRISLPHGIDQLLSEHELDAVLIHELAHARRRDNLIWLVHEFGLCCLWFHPLAWITGARLALYRELSCDEFVIERAHGGDLVSALVKLAHRDAPLLLEARASSFMNRRLARLTAESPRPYAAATALLTVLFVGVVFAGVFGTVSHTACCFVKKVRVPGARLESVTDGRQEVATARLAAAAE